MEERGNASSISNENCVISRHVQYVVCLAEVTIVLWD